MQEISSVSDVCPSTNSSYEEKRGPWQKTGRVAFVFFSLLSAFLVHASLKKKRRVSLFYSSAQPQTAETREEGESEGTIPYAQLRKTERDQRQVREIITTMGRYAKEEIGVLHLVRRRTEFLRYEREMEEGTPLHSFKFLEILCETPLLAQYVPFILRSRLLKTQFLQGIDRGMRREKAQGNVERYIEPFAQTLGVDPEDIRPSIAANDWSTLLAILVEKTCVHGEERSLE